MDEQVEEFAQQLYENEVNKPLQPWGNLSESTKDYYRQYARNLIDVRP